MISSPAVSGDVWVHFSDIVMEGYQELQVGESVAFSWEEARQDEYLYRAVLVFREDMDSEATARDLRRMLDRPSASSEQAAYSSHLEIDFDGANPPRPDGRSASG